MDLKQSAQLTIILVIFAGTSISNASVGVLMYRFKSLRTVPNLLILSSCIADVLNQLFNIPGVVAVYIAKDSKYFVGRSLALALTTFHLFFILANLMSMTLMMVDRLCAFKFNIAYRVWRTKSKAFKAIATKWISCLVIVLVLLVPIWDVELGNVPTYKYRIVYFAKRGTPISFVMFPFFIINNAIVAIVTCSVIHHKNKVNAKNMGLKQSSLDQARKITEIKAIKTIGITVMVFFVCYIPATVYATFHKLGVISSTDPREASWFGLFTICCAFLPGLLNPFIYAIRTRRFRRALKCFLKDPFGTSDISQ